MLAKGFVEEVRELLGRGYGPDLKSMQSLGYRHVAQHLVEARPLDEMVEELKRDTRRFAKRQLSWFGNDPGVHWRNVADEDTAEAVAGALIEELNERVRAK